MFNSLSAFPSHPVGALAQGREAADDDSSLHSGEVDGDPHTYDEAECNPVVAVVDGDEDGDGDDRGHGNDHRDGDDFGGRTPVFSAEEMQRAPTVHPTSERLFAAHGGKWRWIRRIPIFGQAIEVFGPKLLFALDTSEFLSKGVANYTLQNAYQPMFMDRFQSTTDTYQKYTTVAQMGWNVKPLVALLSDSIVIGGFKKRYYLIFSAVLGTVACLGFGILPAKEASGQIASGMLFLASFAQANLDILTEGFYSRLIRAEPGAGPSLVSSIWWCLNVGSIVSAFIEGPLSDAGKPEIGVYVAMACMALTIPIFLFNLFGEKKNVRERLEDHEKVKLIEEARAAAAGASEVDELDVTALLNEDALKGSFNFSHDTSNATTPQSRPIPPPQGAAFVSQGKNHHKEEGLGEMEMAPASAFDTVLSPLSDDLDEVTIEVNSNDHDNNHHHNNDTADSDALTNKELRQMLGVKQYLGGLIQINSGVISKNYRISLMAIIMSACVITQAVVTTIASTWVIVGVSAGICVVICGMCFWVFPIVIAKAALFAFLQTLFYIQINSPLNNFYLADEQCIADGPHFSYFFYNTVSAVIGNVAGMGGVVAFTYIFSKRSYRITFIVTTLAEILGSVFDLIMVMRWNVKLHIPDHVMYICGDAVVYQAAYMLAWMPMVVLLSRLCPRGSEAMVYALLASVNNLGQTMAQEVGVALLSTVWPVHSQAPNCDFSNLKWLIIVGHLLTPLLIIPAAFLLIPSARVCDEIDDKGRVISKELEENNILRQNNSANTNGNNNNDDVQDARHMNADLDEYEERIYSTAGTGNTETIHESNTNQNKKKNDDDNVKHVTLERTNDITGAVEPTRDDNRDAN